MTHEELNKNYTDFAQKHSLQLSGALGELQKEALSLFEKQGLPTRKHEDWIYTSITKGLSELPKLAQEDADISINHSFAQFSGKIIFINGHFSPKHSELPKGVQLQDSPPESLEEGDAKLIATQDGDSFEALNLAIQQRWIKLNINKNTVLKDPLFLGFYHTENSQGLAQARLSIEFEENAEAFLYEVHEQTSQKAIESNDVVGLKLKNNAKCKHVKANYLSRQSWHVGKTKVSQARDSRYEGLSFSLGGAMVRHNIRVDLNEQGAHASCKGLYALQSNQHTDHFIQLHHHAAHSTSDQLFKGILADESRGVFTGKVVVHRDAQKVDSAQLNKNLILGKKAHADTRPQLEVYADDVKCAHGATVGQIDQDEVFYLQSRGLSKQKAQFLLCHAFGAETLQTIDHPEILKELSRRLEEDFEASALNAQEIE